jgi:DNA-binding transcriptional LysR family regulator
MFINYELLKTLVEAGSAPTFRDAARSRHVTPSAVSHQMRTLEAQIGVPLFERIGRRAKLTAAGAKLVASLRDDFGRIDEALAAVIDDASSARGTIRIGGPGPFSRMWLRPRIIALLGTHPELVLDVRFGVASVLARDLADGALDLAILGRTVDEPGLESAPIHTEELCAVASPSRRVQATARALREHPFAVFDDDLAMHAPWWRAAFGKKEPLPAKIVCRVASLDELLALAEADVAIVALPSFFVEESVRKKRVRILATKRAKNTLHLAWRKGMHATRRFEIVREALRR